MELDDLAIVKAMVEAIEVPFECPGVLFCDAMTLYSKGRSLAKGHLENCG